MTDLLTSAIIIATKQHEGQVDKSGQPYILHPLRVMLALQGDEDAMIVAVLHDVVEDTVMEIVDLADCGFPAHILEAVAALTRPGPEAPNRPTYKEYIRNFRNNDLARKVKIADLLDNSSAKRMAQLDLQTRAGLTKRYQWAMDELIDQETGASLPNDTVDMRSLLRVVEDDDDSV